jgi:hypothetical protein
MVGEEADLCPLFHVIRRWRLELAVHDNGRLATVGAGSRGLPKIGNTLKRLATNEADVRMKIRSHQFPPEQLALLSCGRIEEPRWAQEATRGTTVQVAPRRGRQLQPLAEVSPRKGR